MIYICTVHYQTEIWIKPQLKFIQKNVDRPHKILACVPQTRNCKDYYLESCYENDSTLSYNHADKLNYLSKIVCLEAKPTDVIIFLDGDAFPIKPIGEYLEEKLNNNAFIAVQRKENDGDMNPHPSFAATTVDFWTKIEGDWFPGHSWKNCYGKEVTDTGGNLLKILNEQEIKWYPLNRTNRTNIHPLWFGIYDDVVYHHGAGYRLPISRVDLKNGSVDDEEFLLTSEYARSCEFQRNIFFEIRKDINFFERFL
jgi:hypothetical protein